MQFFKKKYYSLRAILNIVCKDLKDGFPLPIWKKLSLWNKGFLAEKHILYRFDRYDSKKFLSDYDTSMSRWINEPYNNVLTNKYIFAKIIGQKTRVPKTFGLIIKGTFFSENHKDLNDIIKLNKKFVIKPVTGGGGKGVGLCEVEENKTIRINGKSILGNHDFLNYLSKLDNFLITEFITPGRFSMSLNPDTINTLRVLTMIHPKSQKLFIAKIVHRVGVKNSFPMDNFTKGGLSIEIDKNTGEMGTATFHPKSIEHIRIKKHPESDFKFYGVKVPNWHNIVKQIHKIASSFPMLKCVGWDFILTDDEIIPIEGNHHPDPDVLQGHGPLLASQKVIDFYTFHKIIK